MAKSPTHKFGQIIGEMLERAMEDPFREFVDKYDDLYLDKKGHRRARSGKKVSWTDKYGNAHDLDFVMERGGTEFKIGTPIAFIEVAWRRYTKHSRNKAQEIQGAIKPLVETYSGCCPFTGVILGGVFTEGSLTQLKSLGFEILYFNYDTIINAFSVAGIDAFYDEDTADDEAQEKVDVIESLSKEQVNQIEKQLLIIKSDEINAFMKRLEKMVLRKIESILVVPLHGQKHEVFEPEEAIEYIQNYKNDNDLLEFIKFEIFIRYNNGDKIEAFFEDKKNAISFLNNFK